MMQHINMCMELCKQLVNQGGVVIIACPPPISGFWGLKSVSKMMEDGNDEVIFHTCKLGIQMKMAVRACINHLDLLQHQRRCWTDSNV